MPDIGRAEGTAQNAAAEKESSSKLDWKIKKEEQAKLRKRQNELKKTEDSIHQLETRNGEIDQLLTKEEIYTNVEKLVELNQEKEQIEEELTKLYEIWETLAEEY